MIWTGIVDQIIIGPFKVDEGVKLDSANYCDFMAKTFFYVVEVPLSKFQGDMRTHAR